MVAGIIALIVAGIAASFLIFLFFGSYWYRYWKGKR